MRFIELTKELLFSPQSFVDSIEFKERDFILFSFIVWIVYGVSKGIYGALYFNLSFLKTFIMSLVSSLIFGFLLCILLEIYFQIKGKGGRFVFSFLWFLASLYPFSIYVLLPYVEIISHFFAFVLKMFSYFAFFSLFFYGVSNFYRVDIKDIIRVFFIFFALLFLFMGILSFFLVIGSLF